MIPAITSIIHTLVYQGIDKKNMPIESKKSILRDTRLLIRPLIEAILFIERLLYEEAISFSSYSSYTLIELTVKVKSLLIRGIGTMVFTMETRPVSSKRKVEVPDISGDVNTVMCTVPVCVVTSSSSPSDCPSHPSLPLLNLLPTSTSTSNSIPDSTSIPITVPTTTSSSTSIRSPIIISESEIMNIDISTIDTINTINTTTPIIINNAIIITELQSNSSISPPPSKRKTPIKSQQKQQKSPLGLFSISDFISHTTKPKKSKYISKKINETIDKNENSIEFGFASVNKNYSMALDMIKDIDNDFSNDKSINNINDENYKDKDDNNKNGKNKDDNNNTNNDNKNNNDNNDNNNNNINMNTSEQDENMVKLCTSGDLKSTHESMNNCNISATSTSTSSALLASDLKKDSGTPVTTLSTVNNTGDAVDCYSQVARYRWQEDFIGKESNKNRKIKFRVILRDSIPKILKSFLGDDGMSELEIIRLFGDHIHNIEYFLFLQAKSKKEYLSIETLKERVQDLLIRINQYLHPNKVINI